MSRRRSRHLGHLVPLAVTVLLIAGCGRSPHTESDVRDAFAAEGFRLGGTDAELQQFQGASGLGELTAVLVQLSAADPDSELIVWVFASAAAAARTGASPILDNARLATQGCEVMSRSNVVVYACKGPGLQLARVRQAMAALG